MIELEHVTKRYYTLVALDQLSLTIHANEVLGIVGPNGAGKTTLSGRLSPNSTWLNLPTNECVTAPKGCANG